MKRLVAAAFLVAMLCGAPFAAAETFPAAGDGSVPRSFEELWAGFDPRAEPLDTEILAEWEEDGVVVRIVRYRIGVFKGRKAMMAAVYGFPKGGSRLPALLQIHGGGQFANANAVITNARRGYATLSIAWAGRIESSAYKVGNQQVRAFWDGDTSHPDFRLTTDWGALDAYHAPSRFRNSFPILSPAGWTLDNVDSPRNNGWFLCTVGARRGLTFLEQQPEVDPGRLGVYGHSMGGKLTVMTAATDQRVKAAAPSCGGISDRYKDSGLFGATLGDDQYLRRISCPVIFLSPANDFHGRIDDLQQAIVEIRADQWRATCSPHLNHRDSPEHEVAGPLWFDQHLLGDFTWPETPASRLQLDAACGGASFSLVPDTSREILSVDVYYTQQGGHAGSKDARDNTINRFWHYARPLNSGNTWTARLPLISSDRPLWVYANVVYALDRTVVGAGYYYRTFSADRFVVSTRMHAASPGELAVIGIPAGVQATRIIETFEGDWEKEWFTYTAGDWGRQTHKVYDPRWSAPSSARLALELRAEKSNTLVLGLDGYVAEVAVTGDPAWQTILLSPGDFHDLSGEPLTSWASLKELRIGAEDTLRQRLSDEDVKVSNFGAPWAGPDPEFRLLRWLGE